MLIFFMIIESIHHCFFKKGLCTLLAYIYKANNFGEKLQKFTVEVLKNDITENHLLLLIKLLLFKIYIAMLFKCKNVCVKLLTEFLFFGFLIQSNYCEKIKTYIYI